MKLRNLPCGMAVLDPHQAADPELELAIAAGEIRMPKKRRMLARVANDEESKRRHTYSRLITKYQGIKAGMEESDDEAGLDLVPTGFADQYFMSPANARPLSLSICRAAAKRSIQASGEPPAAHGQALADESKAQQREWLGSLQMGFSLLVQGVGSKWRVLESFADEALAPWGANIVRINGFDASFSMADCLRDTLQHLFPSAKGTSHSPEVLASILRSALQTPTASARPLCLVVHNIESLPSTHQFILATLAATPGVHLAASIDNIWAPLAWTSRCLKDFNFCREEAHTFESFELEHNMRYSRGLPAWSNPLATRQRAPKASLGLVLRSLTRSHRELVQAVAEHQLTAGGRAGLSQSRLLTIAADRMIAATSAKLRSLLNELKDHEVMAQRCVADGGVQLYLTCDNKKLKRLAEGLEIDDESGDDESGAEGH